MLLRYLQLILLTLLLACMVKEPKPKILSLIYYLEDYYVHGKPTKISDITPKIDINKAYMLQFGSLHRFLREDKIAGYKAGLTSKASRSYRIR